MGISAGNSLVHFLLLGNHSVSLLQAGLSLWNKNARPWVTAPSHSFHGIGSFKVLEGPSKPNLGIKALLPLFHPRCLLFSAGQRVTLCCVVRKIIFRSPQKQLCHYRLGWGMPWTQSTFLMVMAIQSSRCRGVLRHSALKIVTSFQAKHWAGREFWGKASWIGPGI